MANNNQQFYTRDSPSVNEVSSIPSQDKIYNLLHKLNDRLDRLEMDKSPKPCNAMEMSKAMVAPSCDFCASPMHISSNCPSRYEEVAAFYQQKPNQFPKRDPFSNTYNEGWRDHPNFKWGGGGNNFPNRFQGNNGGPSNFNQNHQPSQEPSRVMVPIQDHSKPIEDNSQLILKELKEMRDDKQIVANSLSTIVQHMERMQKELEKVKVDNASTSTFVTQLANNMSSLQAQTSGTLPSNTVMNPKGLNAIHLRSGQVVGDNKRLEEDKCLDLGEPSGVKMGEPSVVEPPIQEEAKSDFKLQNEQIMLTSSTSQEVQSCCILLQLMVHHKRKGEPYKMEEILSQMLN